LITLKKLGTLSSGTRFRKCGRLFHQAALDCLSGIEPDRKYLAGLITLVSQDAAGILGDAIPQACILFAHDLTSLSRAECAFRCDDLSHLLLSQLGEDQADWDFVERDSKVLDSSKRLVLPHTMVIDRVRSPFNIGSLFRAADSFGVDQILLVSPATDPRHPRSLRTARGCVDTVPWEELPIEALRERIDGRPVFALELGGVGIGSFFFPMDGVVVVGSEELGVSPDLLSLADGSLGRVTIPLAGTKGSLNVSVAAGILLHTWFSFQNPVSNVR
jgi:RNA methyltransferase, TrmH family